jgi:hypothetical protein
MLLGHWIFTSVSETEISVKSDQLRLPFLEQTLVSNVEQLLYDVVFASTIQKLAKIGENRRKMTKIGEIEKNSKNRIFDRFGGNFMSLTLGDLYPSVRSVLSRVDHIQHLRKCRCS